MEKHTSKIPLIDLNQAAFHVFHGMEYDIEVRGNTAFFLFDNDSLFNELSNRYFSNENIGVLGFVKTLRKLRSCMYAAKANGNGKHGNNNRE